MKKYAIRPIHGETLLDHLLFYRGIISSEETEKFLRPDYVLHTHDPFLMKDMDKAAERLIRALRDNEKTVIWSDYDTDGIPGAVALHDFFKKIGFGNFENYIPHRHDEGFGLNLEAIEELGKGGVKLLITIDCGTANAAEISRAKELGIDVIVTDHHLTNGKLPDAFAILNPKQSGCAYPDKNLCGAGVAFKLVQGTLALMRRQIPNSKFQIPNEGWEKWLLDMVGIATLSDMVPLTGENRVFAYYGLMVLRKSPRVGLMKLFSKLKVSQRHLTEDDVGFTVGPRINAASRMGEPLDAFQLLATTDEILADTLADHLNKINDERKGTVAALSKEIKKIVRERYEDALEKQNRVMVIGNPSWRPALLGLAANTCANEYRCPVFLWGRDGDNVIKGSCRSGESANLVELMSRAAAGTFLEFGGHAYSGGFSVANEKIHTLEKELNRAFAEAAVSAAETAAVSIDRELSLPDASWNTYRAIEKLSPFGTGNPKPTFLFRNITPSDVRQFGKEKNHLELVFEKPDGVKLSALAFFKSADGYGKDIRAGQPINLVATFEKSMFRNFPELRLRIVDII